METIILASKSPRRKEILEMLDWKFEVCTQETEEIFEEGKSIEENMKKIAMKKAKAVMKGHEDSLILSCDTMVVLENRIFGKPKNVEERSEEHTSELQSRQYLVCRLLLEKKKNVNDLPYETPSHPR